MSKAEKPYRKPVLHKLLSGTTSFVAGVLLASTAFAAEKEQPNPYALADSTWITINGVVQSVSADTFMLDYGDNVVVVEMDDGDRDADAYNLLTGDEVTVSGLIDDDFFEATTIEASAVYVKNLGTTFFSSSVDEEDREAIGVFVTAPIPRSHTVIQGKVTRVLDGEFIVDNGNRELRVETSELSYDPLDDEGYQRIDVGDRVRVSGKIDHELFRGREIVADLIIELYGYPPAS